MDLQTTSEALNDLLARARRAALEEAARICDDWEYGDTCAAKIRELIRKSNPKASSAHVAGSGA